MLHGLLGVLETIVLLSLAWIKLQEFADVKEIYRLNNNIVERLRRNYERLRYVLGIDE